MRPNQGLQRTALGADKIGAIFRPGEAHWLSRCIRAPPLKPRPLGGTQPDLASGYLNYRDLFCPEVGYTAHSLATRKLCLAERKTLGACHQSSRHHYRTCNTCGDAGVY